MFINLIPIGRNSKAYCARCWVRRHTPIAVYIDVAHRLTPPHNKGKPPSIITQPLGNGTACTASKVLKLPPVLPLLASASA